MLKTILLYLVFVLTAATSFAQSTGKIVGKIISAKNGEPLIGATVTLQGKTRITRSDMNGQYSFGGLADGTYTLVISYVSFTTKTIANVEVKGSEAITQDVVMEEKGKMDAVVIRSSGSSKPKETVNSLIIAQKNSANVSDGVSAETIKKTPDKNTSDILKRVSGASIQDDKFVIVRGLNDRYNAAFLNGAQLPSTESDRKAFSFDIFPANMLDNLIIYKTATPDLPGEFAGGTILINTKDIPTQNFSTLTFGTAYNSITTFKQKLTYHGGLLDFMGLDDGTRALPSGIPSTDSFPQPASMKPTLSRQLKNHWGTWMTTALPNINFQLAKGINVQRKDKDFFGALFSLTYNRSYNTSETTNKEHQDGDLGDTSGVKTLFNQQVYTTNSLIGLLGNFSLKLNEKNTISFKNIFSINAEDKIIARQGYSDKSDSDPLYSEGKVLWFTSNKILSSQLAGDHYFSKSKIRLNWLLAYSSVDRSTPDLRTSIYSKKDSEDKMRAGISDNATTNGGGGGIYYASLNENSKNLKFDIQRTFKIGNSFSTLFKVGAYLQGRDRAYGQRNLGLIKYNQGLVRFNNNLLYLPEDKIFALKNMYKASGTIGGFILAEDKSPSNNYTANTNLSSAYAMVDQRFWKFLRLIYGARFENYTTQLNLPLGGGFIDTVKSTVLDILPSANVIISLSKTQNLRLSYSKTVNRPEFREMAPAKFYDFSTRYVTNGDVAIRRALIENYDVRYEIYPGRGQMVTLSGFYKKFTDPIEQATAPDKDHEAAYFNVLGAVTKGVEFEFRTLLGALFNKTAPTNLLNKLTVFSNISFIQSTVNAKKAGDVSLIGERPLQGQSPYVFNGGINFQDDKNGWSATLVGNRVGQRIYIVGNLKEADVWENGRTVIDFQLAKTFQKNKLELKLNVRDILAQKLIFFEDINNDKKYTEGSDYVRWDKTYGRVVSLNISYKF